MTRIGLLSDTHGYLDPTLETHFSACDEIWHAGDIGSPDVIDRLQTWGKTLRLVFGNIDEAGIRSRTQEDFFWECESVRVFMTHIAGYPGKYNKRVQAILQQNHPGLVVCGHSHILKVMYDQVYGHLHLNPGASGRHGMHLMRTAIRFAIDGAEIREMQIVELGKRGALTTS